MHQTAFESWSNHCAKKPGQIIHSDVGSFEEVSREGYKYFVTFVNESWTKFVGLASLFKIASGYLKQLIPLHEPGYPMNLSQKTGACRDKGNRVTDKKKHAFFKTSRDMFSQCREEVRRLRMIGVSVLNLLHPLFKFC
jgi:hypothetical protein